MVDQSKTSDVLNGAKSRAYNAATDAAKEFTNNAHVEDASKAVKSAADTVTSQASKYIPEARDVANRVVSATSEFATQFGGKVMDKVGNLPQVGRDVAGRVNTSAKANPWLHIGLAGVGALAIGYLLGRQSAAIEEVISAKFSSDKT